METTRNILNELKKLLTLSASAPPGTQREINAFVRKTIDKMKKAG